MCQEATPTHRVPNMRDRNPKWLYMNNRCCTSVAGLAGLAQIIATAQKRSQRYSLPRRTPSAERLAPASSNAANRYSRSATPIQKKTPGVPSM